MGIENDLINIIHKEVDMMDSMSEGHDSEFSSAIDIQMVQKYIVQNHLAESADQYLEQPMDVLSETEQESRILLGSYTPMQSPGVLILYQDNLRNFFWAVVRDVLYADREIEISPNDLKHTAEALVLKVWWHEQFHFCCDVFRQLFGSTFDPVIEEALAVAYSRQKLLERRAKGQANISKIHPQFFSGIIKRAYAYKSPGYQDWPDYSDELMFSQGLIQYVMSHGNKLERKGVDLSMMPKKMISSLLDVKQNGYAERLI